MAEQNIKIPKASDKVLISCFKDIANISGVNHIAVNAFGHNNLGAIYFDDDPGETLELILKKNSAIIETINMSWLALTISFHRGGRCPPQEKSGVFDEIVISRRQNQDLPEKNLIIEAVSIINKKLKAFDPNRTGTKVHSEEQAHFEAIHNSNIERLELLNEELTKSTHDYRLKLDDDHQKKIELLEIEFQNKKKQLDEDYDQQRSELLARENELEEKKKALDDSNNTHARREIRRDILKEIKARQDKFSLTDGTNDLRKPIQYAMIGLITIFIALGTLSAIEFYEVIKGNDLNKIIISAIKQALYSGGAIASIIFYIRWMNRWFELHSQSEFSQKQFELDVERANWLVETSLEWKDAKGSSIPAELLESLSRNLFMSEGQKVEQIQHPVDQLASALMGSASSVKLKAGDSSIEIDPKKLAKSKLE